MKIYEKHIQEGGHEVYFDRSTGIGFPRNIGPDRPNHILYDKMVEEVGAGLATVISPSVSVSQVRRIEYENRGLASGDWLEAIVEFLGTLPNPPEKFKALWEKREEIKQRFPK